MTTFTDKVKNILTAAVQHPSIADIAKELGVTVNTVSGSLATIKKANLATYEDKQLVLTAEGLAVIGVTSTKTKKKKNNEIVDEIVAAHPELATTLMNPELVKLIGTALGKDKVDSRVYLYNHEKRHGKRTPGTAKVAAATPAEAAAV